MSDGASPAPLVVIRGDASPEEVAALVAVLQATAASAAVPVPQQPASEWSAHHRKVRRPLHAGPAGWRSSTLPH